MTNCKRIICITLTDCSVNPFPELALEVLARDGWEVTLVAPNARQSVMQLVKNYPCKRHDLPSPTVSRWRYEVAIQGWLQKARVGAYDVIYLHSQQLGVHAAIGLLGPLFGKRLIHHTHDFFDPLIYRTYAYLEGCIARRSAAHLNGEFHRAYICRALYRLRRPVYVVPPHLPSDWPVPPPSEELRRRLGAKNPNDIALILHGGHSRLRATDELLVALAALPSNFKLALTARETRGLRRDIELLGISDRVTFLGRIDYLNLLAYTASADVGIMLHVNSDLGNFFQGPGRLTEYIACGLPVLASHFTGLQLLMSKHQIGASVNPGSPEDIRRGLLEIAAGIRSGRLAKESIKACFKKSFAFDHWEPTIRYVFARAPEPSSVDHQCSPPPDFASISGSIYTDVLAAPGTEYSNSLSSV